MFCCCGCCSCCCCCPITAMGSPNSLDVDPTSVLWRCCCCCCFVVEFVKPENPVENLDTSDVICVPLSCCCWCGLSCCCCCCCRCCGHVFPATDVAAIVLPLSKPAALEVGVMVVVSGVGASKVEVGV